MPTHSIAVLPFHNLSSDRDTDYFCDGITEEIINALANIPQLKVTSRTSSFYFKDHKLTISEIGEKLNTQSLLEGSVRLGGDKMRITAQLINVSDDTHFWSQTWDRSRENIFEVQDEISIEIAEKLREQYGHLDISDHLVKSPTSNLSAYDHYLKGKHHFFQWNPAEANKAIEEFQKVVSLDPGMIEGYLGLADSYSFMAVAGFAPREEAWQKAIEAIEQAKKIDPDHAGLNYMLGNQAFFTKADFKSAMNFGLRSQASNPTFSEAHRFLSFLYSLKGDFIKSREHILYAKSVDPLSSETRFFEANYLYRSGKLEEAHQIIEELLEENPGNLPAIAVNVYILIKKGELDQAENVINQIPEEVIAPDEKLGLQALVKIYRGDRKPAQLSALEEKKDDPMAHHAHSYLFIIYATLGRNDEAFTVLENLFKFKSSVLLLGFSEPLSENIKSDKRFVDHHRKIYAIDEVTEKPKKSSNTGLDASKSLVIKDQLLSYMDSELPYLNPSLSLRLLADQIEVHPNHLSWLVNESLGKNFNEFINQYRIEHFKKLASDPSNAHISLIGLAYESGFNSKTVFNTAFKKLEGMTPKEFQKQHL
jgi:adenylate cyclase